MQSLTRLQSSLAVIALALAPAAFADTYTLDLARDSTTEFQIAPGDVTILLINRVPTTRYDVSVLLETIPIPELAVVKPAPFLGAAEDPCVVLINKVTPLLSPKNETEVEQAIRKLIPLSQDESCQEADIVQEVRGNIDSFIKQTRQLVPRNYAVERGERLVVRVRRGEGETLREWTMTLTTGSRGKWITTYGIGLAPDRDETYTTKATGDGKFAIAADRKPSTFQYNAIPSVFFSWIPASRANKNWTLSPTGGFGIKGDRPAFFAGATATFNWNLAFSSGLALYPQKRLAGQYEPDQVVSETLTADQLHEDAWRPHYFFAFTFRFGSNPFEGDSTAKSASTPKSGTER